MKTKFLFSVILTTLLLFFSTSELRAFDDPFDSPFGDNQSFGSGGNTSGDAFERITDFGGPFGAPPPGGGGPPGGGDGGINIGEGGDEDDDKHRNDAPIGNGLAILLGIAAIHGLIVMLRRKRKTTK